MKISGSKRKGQHVGHGSHDEVIEEKQDGIISGDGAGVDKSAKKSRKKLPIVLGIVVGLLFSGSAYAYFFVRSALDTPPPLREAPFSPNYITPTPPNIARFPEQNAEAPEGAVVEHERDDTKYTFLILATDDGDGNTDVMMVATFDTYNRTMEVVNIPRDTLMNVSWHYKRANNILAAMRQQYGWDSAAFSTAMDGTIEKLSSILGFMVDYWVVVDMRAFVQLVNAIDGVWFDVPVNMNYTDSAAGLHINYSRGLQLLKGQQALEVMRFRQGYANQDIGRIGTQQDFLMTAAKQILENSSQINVHELASIFINYVRTDLELSHLIWFGNEFLKFNPDNINFHVMPGNYMDWAEGMAIVTIYVNQWLTILNEHISPFQEELLATDLSILTRNSNGQLYATDGNRQGNASWGSSGGQAYSPDADTSVNSGQTVEPPSTPNGDSTTSPGPSDSPSSGAPGDGEPPQGGEPPEGGEGEEPHGGGEPSEGGETGEGGEDPPVGEPGTSGPPDEGPPPQGGEEPPPPDNVEPPADSGATPPEPNDG